MFMCTVKFGTIPEILLTISGILAIIFFVSIGLLKHLKIMNMNKAAKM